MIDLMRTRKIVYFAGAGLTKSLEKSGKPIPLMYDFVRVMADYVRHEGEDIILTTLAELENAGAFQATSPEAQRLAKSVVGQNRDTRQETRDAFRRAFCDRPSESIEDLLLRALELATGMPESDGEAALRKSSAASAAGRFGYAINRLFAYWIGWEVDCCPLERFLRSQFASFPLDVDRGNYHTFISFNYDLILDRTVQRIARDRFEHECWVPSTGYGFPIEFFVDEEPVPAQNGFQSYPHGRQYPPMPCINVEILKPHGSLNWLVPHKDHKVVEYGVALNDGPVFTPLTQNGGVDYWRSYNSCDNLVYERANAPNCPGEHIGICVLPPMPPAKQPVLGFLKSTRCKEEAAVRDADDFYILGWSMPKTDRDQLELIKGAIAARKRPIERVVVVNWGESPEYFSYVQETFGVAESNLEKHNVGFRDFAERL